VIRYLKFFTFLPKDEIEKLEEAHKNPSERIAHEALASRVCVLIHGDEATERAIIASDVLFGGSVGKISEAEFNEIIGEVPTKEIEKSKLAGAGISLAELLVHAGLCSSKGQARKDIEGGGIYVNNDREANAACIITLNNLLFGKHILLRKGKKNYVVVKAK
jgi:tyrosyl-tRNA synthetase